MENKFLVISFNPETGETHWDLVLAENALMANAWIKKVRQTEVVVVFGILLLLESAQFMMESPVEDIRHYMKEFEQSEAAGTESPTTPY
jgi:hypothetical protein